MAGVKEVKDMTETEAEVMKEMEVTAGIKCMKNDVRKGR
jgi:hypothetical protein